MTQSNGAHPPLALEPDAPKTEPAPPPGFRGGFWRARLVQPYREAFFCTDAFQAVSQSEALKYAVWLTGRPASELEVEAVSIPGMNPKGKKHG